MPQLEFEHSKICAQQHGIMWSTALVPIKVKSADAGILAYKTD